MNIDLTTIVVTESLKLLLKDGWDFLKNQAGPLLTGSSDLIQLNIGGAPVSRPTAVEETVANALNSSQLQVPYEIVNELGGLNRRLEALSIKRRNLTSQIERASTAVDKANVQTELELVESDILDVKRKVWSALKDTGHISLEVSRGVSPV